MFETAQKFSMLHEKCWILESCNFLLFLSTLCEENIVQNFMNYVNNVWQDISALLIAIVWNAAVVSVETSRSIRTCILFLSPRKESLTDRNCSLCFANADEHNAVVFPAASCTLLLNSFHFPLSSLLLPSLHWRRFTLSCLPYVYLFSSSSFFLLDVIPFFS
jgi:hypothetical protein